MGHYHFIKRESGTHNTNLLNVNIDSCLRICMRQFHRIDRERWFSQRWDCCWMMETVQHLTKPFHSQIALRFSFFSFSLSFFITQNTRIDALINLLDIAMIGDVSKPHVTEIHSLQGSFVEVLFTNLFQESSFVIYQKKRRDTKKCSFVSNQSWNRCYPERKMTNWGYVTSVNLNWPKTWLYWSKSRIKSRFPFFLKFPFLERFMRHLLDLTPSVG